MDDPMLERLKQWKGGYIDGYKDGLCGLYDGGYSCPLPYADPIHPSRVEGYERGYQDGTEQMD